MAIKQHDLRRPVLEIVNGAKGDIIHRDVIVKKLEEHLFDSLTEAEGAMLQEGQQGRSRLTHWTGWVLSYLKKAGFTESPSQLRHRITPKGQEVVAAERWHVLEIRWHDLDAVRQERAGTRPKREVEAPNKDLGYVVAIELFKNWIERKEIEKFAKRRIEERIKKNKELAVLRPHFYKIAEDAACAYQAFLG